ncbi:MAG: hypothetical protein HYV63_31690 [Candidatus Schekmanbacteria bacterium]|nr:hypothetical protein [Candidatus Schekmanbacteria bacterium]
MIRARSRLLLKLLLLVASLPGALSGTAAAQTSEKLAFHGYGSWGYGRTDGNAVSIGTEEGSYENLTVALSVTGQPTERLTVHMQPHFLQTPTSSEIEIDYAFGEWAFSDQLRFRLGKIRHSFGNYADVYEIGTLRPFFDLPTSVYGPAGIIAPAYTGINLTGIILPEDFELSYDLLAGHMVLEVGDGLRLAEGLDLEEDGDAARKQKVRNLIGTYLRLATPLPGLAVGTAAFAGDDPYDGQRNSTWGAFIDYGTPRITARLEIVRHEKHLKLRMNAAYAELAYKLGGHWELATRYESFEASSRLTDRTLPRSLSEHRALALGINYWLSPNFVLRASVHRIRGNFFAFPADREAPIEDTTRLVVLGGQFSF